MKGFILGLIGYALGTAQILVVEWIRDRRAQEQTLRVLRGELGRLVAYRQKFGWTAAGPPVHDWTPRPPRPIDGFIDLVAGADFRRTDEHEKDNSRELLCSIADGCALLQEYVAQMNGYGEDLRTLPDGQGKQLTLELMPDVAMAYDEELDRLRFVIDEMIEDLDRRIERIRLGPQLRRVGRRLPSPAAPPQAITRDDPKFVAWLPASQSLRIK